MRTVAERARAPQCAGSTWDGWRRSACARRTRRPDGYCWQHRGQATGKALW